MLLKLGIKAKLLATAGLATAGSLWYRENRHAMCDKMSSGEPKRRKAVIVGAGVAGVSTAYELSKRGYQVTILDSSSSPGAECSAVSAGMMQYSNPVISPESWMAVLKSWNPFQSNFHFFHIDWLSCLTDPHFIRWISLFTYFSLWQPGSLKDRQKEQLKFTVYAIDKTVLTMEEMNANANSNTSGLNSTGALHVHFGEEPASLVNKASLEPTKRVSQEMLFQLDRCVKEWPKKASSADYETESRAGNSENFTKVLAEIVQDKFHVKIQTNTAVRAIDLEKDGNVYRVAGLDTDQGRIDIDDDTEVVLAAGSWTPKLLSLCGYFCPTYPMKGYNVIMDLPERGTDERPCEEDIPSRMLIGNNIYISRLGEQVRVSSIGEFSGWDTKPNPKVDEAFRSVARGYVPALSSLFDATPTRCGLRPYSADGIIMLGRVNGMENLSVNVGPGHNGWKIAIGAGEVLATTLAGENTDHYKFDCSKLYPDTRIRKAPFWSRLSGIVDK